MADRAGLNRPTIFRQIALNRLSSPDDIDRLLVVTSPRGWLALLGLAIVVGASLAWAFEVTVPLSVAGEGILLKSGGIFEIDFESGGRLVDIAVGAGDIVHEGQVVARVAQPELTDQLEQARARLDRMRAERGARARREARARIHEAEEAVARLERELTRAAEVRSPYTGRIIEVAAEQNSVVARGEPLLTLDLTGRTVAALEAIVYVPARNGKRIKPGMRVQLAPATVRPEEYGYLLGTVTRVSDFPSTSRGMLRVLKNQELVAALSAAGPPQEVHVDLIPDETTTSRYRWSSSKGPPVEMQTGTLCRALVVFDARRPIEIVMPFLRGTGGGS